MHLTVEGLALEEIFCAIVNKSKEACLCKDTWAIGDVRGRCSRKMERVMDSSRAVNQGENGKESYWCMWLWSLWVQRKAAIESRTGMCKHAACCRRKCLAAMCVKWEWCCNCWQWSWTKIRHRIMAFLPHKGGLWLWLSSKWARTSSICLLSCLVFNKIKPRSM